MRSFQQESEDLAFLAGQGESVQWRRRDWQRARARVRPASRRVASGDAWQQRARRARGGRGDERYGQQDRECEPAAAPGDVVKEDHPRRHMGTIEEWLH